MADNYTQMGSVWALMQSGELLRFSSSRPLCIGRDRWLWRIFTEHESTGKESLIAYIRKCKVVSIGFGKPEITKPDTAATAGEVLYDPSHSKENGSQ